MRLNRPMPVFLALGLLLSCTWAVAQDLRVTGSTATVGPARITFLTTDLVRLEWSEEQQWADWPSAVVVGREWPAVQITREDSPDGVVVLKTPDLTVRYTPAGRFGAENLTIESPRLAGPWHPGDPDPGNLGGTRHSLDGVKGAALPPLGQGLLSRSGWFFYDDSGRPLIDPATDWLAERPDANAQDWYFCAYGHDYWRALLLASDLMGHINLPPRFAFGGWYSRYWPFTDAEEREIVNRFRELGIPLDVLVIDVDWHLHGWESYDWNPELFPNPEEFLDWVHAQGCKVTLNNHPGRLPAADSRFADVCRAMGVDPAGREDVQFNLADKTHAEAYFELLHKPLHEQGVDFWWIDGSAAGMRGLDSQMWTSKLYFDYTEKHTGKRGLLFARYGGHGSHRYPTGFSGDTFADWGVLGYEVGFTSRAANVLYPYWSNDIGGFNGDRLPADLYIRWVQFGAFSPILRLHSNHGIREPWEYGPEGIEAARTYFGARYELLPYIYSWARQTYETGEPLCRPLYLDWPEEEEAYRRDDEYLFGDAILVAPIVQAAPAGQPARREVWLPPGEWLDPWTGEAYSSGVISYEADLQRLPMFYRRGSILVTNGAAPAHVGQERPDRLTAVVTVGRPDASFTLYEDDGESKGYQKGEFAKTELRLTAGSSTSQTLEVAPAEGSFEGQVKDRSWRVTVLGRFAPEEVLLDGKALAKAKPRAWDSADESPGWCWEAGERRVSVYLPRRPVTSGYRVELRGGAGHQEYTLCSQALGLGRHLRRVAEDLRALEGDWVTASFQATKAAAKAENLARRLEAGQVPLTLARRTLSEIEEDDLPLLVDAAARGAANEKDRMKALATVLGISLEGRLEVLADGTTARLAPEVLRSPYAPEATQRLLASLQAPDGSRWPDLGRELAYGPYCPVGLVRVSTPLQGEWAGLPVAGELSAVVDTSPLQLFHLVGPFDNAERRGLEAVYPPEQELKIGAELEGKEGPVKWLTTRWRWPTGPQAEPNFINLEPLFKPKDFTVAYAVAYVWAPRDEDGVAYLGSDDECKLWVNGEHVHTFPDPRPPAPDQDRVAIKLRSGWNTLLMKVCQEGGQWGLYVRLAGPDDRPLQGLWTSLAPEGTPPAAP